MDKANLVINLIGFCVALALVSTAIGIAVERTTGFNHNCTESVSTIKKIVNDKVIEARTITTTCNKDYYDKWTEK